MVEALWSNAPHPSHASHSQQAGTVYAFGICQYQKRESKERRAWEGEQREKPLFPRNRGVSWIKNK